MNRCPECENVRPLYPLHGERGGPMSCIECGLEWHAKYSRRRRFGRVAIKAMALFMREGGSFADLDRLKLASGAMGGPLHGLGREILGWQPDTIGQELGDLTRELLMDAVQLTHPDRHPPERGALARRVTQELLALEPFTFPAPKLEPEPEPTTKRDGYKNAQDLRVEELSRDIYPCELCSTTIPYFYCDPCKAEWTNRQRKESEKENAKRRAQYARRRDWRRHLKRPATCTVCASQILTSKRNDATYCSAACRQRVYRANRRLVVAAEAPAEMEEVSR